MENDIQDGNFVSSSSTAKSSQSVVQAQSTGHGAANVAQDPSSGANHIPSWSLPPDAAHSGSEHLYTPTIHKECGWASGEPSLCWVSPHLVNPTTGVPSMQISDLLSYYCTCMAISNILLIKQKTYFLDLSFLVQPVGFHWNNIPLSFMGWLDTLWSRPFRLKE